MQFSIKEAHQTISDVVYNVLLKYINRLIQHIPLLYKEIHFLKMRRNILLYLGGILSLEWILLDNILFVGFLLDDLIPFFSLHIYLNLNET